MLDLRCVGLQAGADLSALVTMDATTALAQLRHLYALMIADQIDAPEAARGLLAPAIAALERVHYPVITVETPDPKRTIWWENRADLGTGGVYRHP